jgi:hypothetical protein
MNHFSHKECLNILKRKLIIYFENFERKFNEYVNLKNKILHYIKTQQIMHNLVIIYKKNYYSSFMHMMLTKIIRFKLIGSR